MRREYLIVYALFIFGAIIMVASAITISSDERSISEAFAAYIFGVSLVIAGFVEYRSVELICIAKPTKEVVAASEEKINSLMHDMETFREKLDTIDKKIEAQTQTKRSSKKGGASEERAQKAS
ncbi:MAG: hypothetical protein M1503_03520 [Thaumarchaeota archaeon]|nr:hypothetical protein [Nitrososphaerota archaeon]MCL5317322.1 hypothetical protein [Nitrososphaerota archaeon]